MDSLFQTIHVVLAVLLSIAILLQHRAAGLTATGMNTMVVQRRGAEKLLYQGTFILAAAFFLLIILEWYA